MHDLAFIEFLGDVKSWHGGFYPIFILVAPTFVKCTFLRGGVYPQNFIAVNAPARGQKLSRRAKRFHQLQNES